MRRLFLVRHGPTHAKAMVGWTDLPADLSDQAAIDRLAEFLPKNALVISSDLIRAVATADAIQRHRLRLPHEATLREMHFGDWEMQRFDEVEDQQLYRAFWEEPGDIAPPNGESWNTVCARVNTAVDALLTQYPDRDIVIVAHFGVILTQVQRAEALNAYDAFAHKIENLSVTEIVIEQNDWSVQRLNHCP